MLVENGFERYFKPPVIKSDKVPTEILKHIEIIENIESKFTIEIEKEDIDQSC